MKTHLNCFAILLGIIVSVEAAEYFVSPLGSHEPPFADWVSAATNLQDAVDAAADGDVIWATNGIYRTGGKAMEGDLTNRVALDKAVTLQSVNGARATIIEGQWDPSGDIGPGAVRCAWLTNGARLVGFTLRGGATRRVTSNSTLAGGGIYCTDPSVVVSQCRIERNRALYGGGISGGQLEESELINNIAGRGGGAWASVLISCVVSGNHAGSGGGARGGNLKSCTLIGNSSGNGGATENCNLENCVLYNNTSIDVGGGAKSGVARNCVFLRNRGNRGGGAYGATLYNCTLVGNQAGSGGGVRNCTLYNCIVWGNSVNYTESTLSYCCSLPLPPGGGNISIDPQLAIDSIHLLPTSPCRSAGSSAFAQGSDIDGQVWVDQAPMGCDSYDPAPVSTLKAALSLGAVFGEMLLRLPASGQEPIAYWWSKDGAAIEPGAHYGGLNTSALQIRDFGVADSGWYQVVLSNAFGMSTSKVAEVNFHFVNASNATPVAPYDTWATAARTIQDAVDMASPDSVVLATNGIYAEGGRVMSWDLTNRVVIEKPLILMSLNGAEATVIQGELEPITGYGPRAVRCVWLNAESIVSGFTLRNGGTRDVGNLADRSGGGVWSLGTNTVVAHCLIVSNAASYHGGGAYQGRYLSCGFQENSASSGGGIYACDAVNCALEANQAWSGGGMAYSSVRNSLFARNQARVGGGAYSGVLNNCTLTANIALNEGGGACLGSHTNCILWNNTAPTNANYAGATLTHSCAVPLAPGHNNLADDPQLVNERHIATSSPCVGRSSEGTASGFDIDGEPWNAPPAIGCDEPWASTLTGPLDVALDLLPAEVIQYSALNLTGLITGRASRLEWEFGDGVLVTNLGFRARHAWTNVGDFQVTLRAFNTDHLEGVESRRPVRVVPLNAPKLVSIIETNGVWIRFESQAGITYSLERATNLIPPIGWTPVATQASTGGVMLIEAPADTNSARYYRLRAP